MQRQPLRRLGRDGGRGDVLCGLRPATRRLQSLYAWRRRLPNSPAALWTTCAFRRNLALFIVVVGLVEGSTGSRPKSNSSRGAQRNCERFMALRWRRRAKRQYSRRRELLSIRRALPQIFVV